MCHRPVATWNQPTNHDYESQFALSQSVSRDQTLLCDGCSPFMCTWWKSQGGNQMRRFPNGFLRGFVWWRSFRRAAASWWTSVLTHTDVSAWRIDVLEWFPAQDDVSVWAVDLFLFLLLCDALKQKRASEHQDLLNEEDVAESVQRRCRVVTRWPPQMCTHLFIPDISTFLSFILMSSFTQQEGPP